MFDGSSQCTIVLPVECLGYGLVVPFLAYRTILVNRATAGEQGTYWAGRRSVGQGATCRFAARRFKTASGLSWLGLHTDACPPRDK
eukprot:scaffold10003_cov78-Phaeocystis_antarctica.AAC.1